MKKLISWYRMWILELEFRRAKKRMLGCFHSKTTIVDVGIKTEKCLDCWALLIDGQWVANTARP
jgi:hypothetical protein